jgi:Fe-S cluster biosynthesis and repair protein YggX
MTHKVFCIKLQKEAPGLDRAPLTSALGERIYAEISKEAWSLWLKQQTILINEKRMILTDPKARAELTQAMESFLFGDSR